MHIPDPVMSLAVAPKNKNSSKKTNMNELKTNMNELKTVKQT